jgi:hypothetical protein
LGGLDHLAEAEHLFGNGALACLAGGSRRLRVLRLPRLLGARHLPSSLSGEELFALAHYIYVCVGWGPGVESMMSIYYIYRASLGRLTILFSLWEQAKNLIDFSYNNDEFHRLGHLLLQSSATTSLSLVKEMGKLNICLLPVGCCQIFLFFFFFFSFFFYYFWKKLSELSGEEEPISVFII